MNQPNIKKGKIKDCSKYVCIVGAGPAGLSLSRSLKHKGILHHVLERHSDVGGIWDIENLGSPMYESAHFISSKYLSGYADFPMPEDYPDYPSRKQILEYHRSFARAYDLYREIQFRTQVKNIEKQGDLWLVELENGEARYYESVVCANGITWSPSYPNFPGRETFSGEILHSKEYRDPSIFKGKRVLIVGAGNSGCDIACDAGPTADSTFISVRRGYHFIPKHIFGIPADVFGDGAHWIPNWFSQWFLGWMLRLIVGDLTKVGLPAPDHKLFETHPIINDQLLHYLRHGDVRAKCDISRLNHDFVEFNDGSRERIDLIVFATGYNWSIPYMDEKYFEWKNGRPDLYLTLFNRRFENLYALGFMETDGGAYKMFDEMANLISSYIEAKRKGQASSIRFRNLIENDRPKLNGGILYLNTGRHSVYVNQVAYRNYRRKLQIQMGWPELIPGQFKPLSKLSEIETVSAENEKS
ncbi:flavin-containing monooxygenase [Leptospira stimsonii]|uniref:NAD(P)/FAD-dependent oxidoreductase n=1 Tax=Leptospira stimsonii TaxID=2202203 RepID=A0ABY2N4X9_9LEPT|nr:NAD(P)-binding domain-containing protein [Leptospira stimsonii]TGK19637.1 NAD(P)/FAD-dependent oxidoreductase [Leptospira stimsonii]TGM17149.1 NAD(P)/FAD-dependent oxidoreductase [Leptospira stimsonii]